MEDDTKLAAEEKAKQEAEEKAKQEAAAKNSDAGTEGQNTPSPLEQAEAINKKKEELLDREERVLERKEKLEATRMVGGRAQGGAMNVERTEDQKKTDNAQEFFKDTALGDAIKKTNE